MEEKDKQRALYLGNFKRTNPIAELFDNAEHIESVGKQIVDLMKKEDLTHDDAYASLQYAYNLIKYESNFLKLL